MKHSARKSAKLSIGDGAATPSSVGIVAAILFGVLLAVVVVVACLWLWNESFVYRGDGSAGP